MPFQETGPWSKSHKIGTTVDYNFILQKANVFYCLKLWHCMLWQAVRCLKRFYSSHYFLCFWNLKLFDPLDFKPFCIYTVNFSVPESGFIYNIYVVHVHIAITFTCWNFLIAFNFFCYKMFQRAKGVSYNIADTLYKAANNMRSSDNCLVNLTFWLAKY